MVYWLVLFSIVVHGLSIPALNLIYKFYGVKPIQEDSVPIRRKSIWICPCGRRAARPLPLAAGPTQATPTVDSSVSYVGILEKAR